VIGELADTVGVSKSAVSRETIEASERVLKELMERRLDAWDLLVVYVDGIQFGAHHVVAAVGVDSDGKKHVLGMREGASENAEITRALLEELVERGMNPERRRLFVVDGSQALRKAIDQVFGQTNPVQRCRNHKIRNVLGHLPKEQHDQVRSAMRAAWKLDAREGEQKLEQLARWLERDHPSAAASLREGLTEMFTINRLGLPPRLRKCLGTTNLIDSTHSSARQKTRRVTHWTNGAMALRWAAASFVETEKKLPPHRRLRSDLDAQSPPRRPRAGCRNEEGKLNTRHPGATAFNYARDIILPRSRDGSGSGLQQRRREASVVTQRTRVLLPAAWCARRADLGDLRWGRPGRGVLHPRTPGSQGVAILSVEPGPRVRRDPRRAAIPDGRQPRQHRDGTKVAAHDRPQLAPGAAGAGARAMTDAGSRLNAALKGRYRIERQPRAADRGVGEHRRGLPERRVRGEP
jgi:transposase-like protein